MEPFVGQICLFGFNFAPRGWAQCNGQLLPIAQNSALYALLGTQFGGNGQTTFGLPDLRGRVALGQGQGPGLSSYNMGQMAGSESVTLISSQMPMHNHSLVGSGNSAAANTLNGNVPASANGVTSVGEEAVTVNTYAAAGNPAMADPSAISMTGGNQPHDNLQPFLCMNYCIALEGIFPSRN